MAQRVFKPQPQLIRMIERVTGAVFDGMGTPYYACDGGCKTLAGFRVEIARSDFPKALQDKLTSQDREYILIVPMADILAIDGVNPYQSLTTIKFIVDDEDMTW